MKTEIGLENYMELNTDKLSVDKFWINRTMNKLVYDFKNFYFAEHNDIYIEEKEYVDDTDRGIEYIKTMSEYEFCQFKKFIEYERKRYLNIEKNDDVHKYMVLLFFNKVQDFIIQYR